MKRHRNIWINTYDDAALIDLINGEQKNGLDKFGVFASPHEMKAIIEEELDEFWDSVKANDPDPKELLQLCALAKRAIIELCEIARRELEDTSVVANDGAE